MSRVPLGRRPRVTPGSACSASPRRSFSSAGVFLERLVEHARHVEVQVFGDGAGPGRHPRRPRLLPPAPQPEGRGGGPGARPARRGPRATRRRPHATLARVGRTTAPPARSSSSTTRPARRRTSWRSTPGSRWSTRSPRRSTASTWSRGCSGWPRATPTSYAIPGHRAGTPSRRASTPRTPHREHRPERGPDHRGSSSRGGVRVDAWIETGHRGHHALRPDARQGHRVRRRPGDAPGRLDEALARHPGRRHRDQPRPGARGAAAPGLPRPRAPHGHPRARERPDAAHRGRRPAARSRRSRTGRAGPATGRWASRRAGRWTTCRSGSATARSATPRARPASSARWQGPALRFTHRDDGVRHRRTGGGHGRRRRRSRSGSR